MCTKTFIMLGVLLCFFNGTMVMAQEMPTSTTITVEETIYFIAPDGGDAVVIPGTYRVEHDEESRLRLIPGEGKAAVLLQATPISHEENLASPAILLVPEELEEDIHHMVLLLPGGKGFNARGSYSQVRTRGLPLGVGGLRPSAPQPGQAVSQEELWWIQRGGKIHFGKRGWPAVLLVHGHGLTGQSWIRPSTAHEFYDYRSTPKAIEDTKSYPGVGIFKVGKSERIDVDPSNWFEFLAGRGFTVATWTQPEGLINAALPSAIEALETLAQQTASISPQAHPPIALIGHSRGGLLIRAVLKEKGNLGGRVRWVVTLHSPHDGSEMARGPAEIAAEVVDLIDAAVPASVSFAGQRIPVTHSLKEELKRLAVELFRPLNHWLGLLKKSQIEMVPDSPFLRNLRSGEGPLEGVQYYTFGGIVPTYGKFYFWVFDAESLVPKTKLVTHGFKSYVKTWFNWTARPVEIQPISPMLDKVRDFVPEVKPGKGDGLVADARSRLPWSIHETTLVNHADVLWDRSLQMKVAGILGSSKAPGALGVPGIPLKLPAQPQR